MLNEKIVKLVNDEEKKLSKEFEHIDDLCEYNSLKVIEAFRKNNISEIHFNSTTGYGYDDIGRNAIDNVFSDILGAESAIVRGQFISGSHALTVCLFGLLRPGDTLLSISGKPYDTLDEVIGIRDNSSSLKSFGVNYLEVDLKDNDFDYDKIKEVITSNTIKVIEIQRSKGYSTRKSITIDKLEKVIKFIKNIDNSIIIMIDNCYCEFVEEKTPLEVGADVIVGSLIKNLGAGMAPNGAYIAGKKDLVDLCAERLTLPGEGRNVGPTLGINRDFLLGIYMAPSVVASALKTAILTSKVMESLGYNVEPKYNEQRADIVQNIIFNDKDLLIKYCQGIQMYSPIDSNALPEPVETPGYADEIIMASGSFTQGSSIEISCDGPIRPPYIAYQQGALTYSYGKFALMSAIDNIKK